MSKNRIDKYDRTLSTIFKHNDSQQTTFARMVIHRWLAECSGGLGKRATHRPGSGRH